ncbi:MAG: hypothetical protein P8Z67_08730, partial [Gammaproteobacteria bacterium]
MSVTQQAIHEHLRPRSFFRSLSPIDWVYAILLFAGAIFAYHKYSYLMSYYGVIIMFAAAAGLSVFGWYWKSIRVLLAVVAAVSLVAVTLYEPAVAALKAQGMSGREAIAALSSF